MVVRIILLAGFLILPFISAFEGYKNAEEAEAALEEMYGAKEGEEAEPSPKNHEDEFNSIRKFVSYVATHKEERALIIFSSKKHYEAAELLRSFLGRKRGFPIETANSEIANISILHTTQLDLKELNSKKAFLLGGTENNPLIRRMVKAGKMQISKTRAQFRLFHKPNVIAFGCQKDAMFLELVRVFIRSQQDFEETVYSYFYLN